jgi:hypothetical protein
LERTIYLDYPTEPRAQVALHAAITFSLVPSRLLYSPPSRSTAPLRWTAASAIFLGWSGARRALGRRQRSPSTCHPQHALDRRAFHHMAMLNIGC